MSRTNLFLVAAILLAAGAAAVNLREYRSAATNDLEPEPEKPKPPEPDHDHDAPDGKLGKGPPAKPLKPIGAEDAKVKLVLYASADNACHSESVVALQRIGEALPERIRVEFADTATSEGVEASEKAGISCEAGLTINGKNKFVFSDGGRRQVIAFHGPLGMETGVNELRKVVEHELDKQYGEELTDGEHGRLEKMWEDLPEVLGGSGGGVSGKSGKPMPDAEDSEEIPSLTTEERKQMDTVLKDILTKGKTGAKPEKGKPQADGGSASGQ